MFCWEPQWDQGTETFTLVPEKGWPILHRGTHGSLATADLDGDGYLELVVPSDDGHVYAYDLPGATVTWAGAAYDLARTGYVPPSGSRPEPDFLGELLVEGQMVATSGNPFREAVRLEFRHVADGPVVAGVFDVGGRMVRSLLDAPAVARGIHQVEWDGRDGAGATAAAGVYFVRIESSGFELVRRVVRVR